LLFGWLTWRQGSQFFYVLALNIQQPTSNPQHRIAAGQAGCPQANYRPNASYPCAKLALGGQVD
jgi:hypothetical protein